VAGLAPHVGSALNSIVTTLPYRPLGIHARLDSTACHDRAAARDHVGKRRDWTLCQGISFLDRAIINTGLSRRPALPVIIERNGDVVEIQPGKLIVLSTRKFEARFQSAAVAIGERERPAKRAGKLLGDGKAKPGATGFAITRSLERGCEAQ
jgi:hypothetical protein